MSIKQITYKRHDNDKPSYIRFAEDGRRIATMERHEIFVAIVRFETAERIKVKLEKRAQGVGVIEIEHHLDLTGSAGVEPCPCCGNVSGAWCKGATSFNVTNVCNC